MQLMLDTSDSPRMLRLASQFLEDAALISEGEIRNGGPLMPADPVLPVLDAEDVRALEAQRADAGHASETPAPIDLRAVFAQPAAPVNVVPPPPVVPPSPAANAAAGGTTPPVATSVTAYSDAQRDAQGFPWDARIHSATPTILKDGSWRQRRNLDNATLVAVESELRARGAVNVVPPPPITPVIPPPPLPAPAGVAPPVAPPVIPPPPNPGFAGGVSTGAVAFRALMTRIGGHTSEGGRLALAIMQPIHAQFGAAGWQDYVTKCNDRIPELTAVIEGLLA